ncbi:hypothetical protein F4814DRAFT_405279 [Daldinia grandis]|nr:hypothetical protein F4814DRAFT_405279 [Daldinia grandis]
MMWDLVIPSRILGLRAEFLDYIADDYSVYYFEPGLFPPSVAHIYREVRLIACRSGRLMSIRNSRGCPYIDSMVE